MNMTLFSSEIKDTGAFGVLSPSDGPAGAATLATLEHVYPTHTGGFVTKLQVGTYTCVRGQHHIHSGPIETFEVTGVPGHTGILFHYGNTQDDSDGCILLGTDRVKDSIICSRAAFTEFMKLQEGCDSFTLIVT